MGYGQDTSDEGRAERPRRARRSRRRPRPSGRRRRGTPNPTPTPGSYTGATPRNDRYHWTRETPPRSTTSQQSDQEARAPSNQHLQDMINQLGEKLRRVEEDRAGQVNNGHQGHDGCAGRSRTSHRDQIEIPEFKGGQNEYRTFLKLFKRAARV